MFEFLETRLMMAPLVGDYNSDNIVDTADYVLARKVNEVNKFQESYGNQSNWFNENAVDEAFSDLGSRLYQDGTIDRNDTINLLNNVKDENVIDAVELNDIKSFKTVIDDEVLKALTGYVVDGTPANHNVGQLTSNPVQLDKLVNKWFFGLDRPTAGGTYTFVEGELFKDGINYTDVQQGTVGTCYVLAALGEIADNQPDVISSMFTDNGDNTYTIRWFDWAGNKYYVTVDQYLPTVNGSLIYARGDLWVSLAEKAYAQLNEFGFSRAGFITSGQNSYIGIDSGYAYAALTHISGEQSVAFNMTATGATNFWNHKDDMVCFISYQNAPNVVSNHVYIVVGYDEVNKTITLYNPWGLQYGLTTMTWAQITSNFMYFDYLID